MDKIGRYGPRERDRIQVRVRVRVRVGLGYQSLSSCLGDDLPVSGRHSEHGQDWPV